MDRQIARNVWNPVKTTLLDELFRQFVGAVVDYVLDGVQLGGRGSLPLEGLSARAGLGVGAVVGVTGVGGG